MSSPETEYWLDGQFSHTDEASPLNVFTPHEWQWVLLGLGEKDPF